MTSSRSCVLICRQSYSCKGEMRRPAKFKAPASGDKALGSLLRLYVYGLHGYFIEVMFTAGWEFVVNNNWKLPGCSSVWSLAIYGISGLAMEQIHDACHRSGVPLLARGVAYLLWVYVWEFSTGLVLRHFGACPWDYTAFHYNVHGLITLEYAPLWFFIALVQEKLVLAHLQRLRWTSVAEPARLVNGSACRSKN